MKNVMVLAVALGLGGTVLAQQAQPPAFTPPKNDAIPSYDTGPGQRPDSAGGAQSVAAQGRLDRHQDGGRHHDQDVDGRALGSGKAGVVIVIHEIYGLTDWVRAVADHVAQDGFIALVLDLLSGMGPNGTGSVEFGMQGSTQTIRNLTADIRPLGSTPQWTTARSWRDRTARPARWDSAGAAARPSGRDRATPLNQR